jgi:replicative DNA helicase
MAVNNTQYERLALNRIMKSRAPELLTKFQPELFGNKDIGNLYRLVRMAYGEQGEFLSFDSLVAELENRVPSKDKLDFLKGVIDDIKGIDDTTSTEMIHEKLNEQHQFRVLIAGAGELTSAVSLKDLAQARARVVEMYDAMFGSDTAHNFTAAGMRSMAGQTIKYNFYKTGIKPLDARGGLIEGGLTIIAGESGAGKSTLAQQFLQHNYHHYPDESCAIFSFEQSKSELRARILASEGDLDVSLISADLLTP